MFDESHNEIHPYITNDGYVWYSFKINNKRKSYCGFVIVKPENNKDIAWQYLLCPCDGTEEVMSDPNSDGSNTVQVRILSGAVIQ